MSIGGAKGFGNLERCKCLSRAAGHDELAALASLEALYDIGNGSILMGSRRFLYDGLLGTRKELLPINRRLLNLCEAYARYRNLLIDNCLGGM